MNPGLSEELTAEIRRMIKAGPHEPRIKVVPFVKKNKSELNTQEIIES